MGEESRRCIDQQINTLLLFLSSSFSHGSQPRRCLLLGASCSAVCLSGVPNQTATDAQVTAQLTTDFFFFFFFFFFSFFCKPVVESCKGLVK
jgi:hypothetical protein